MGLFKQMRDLQTTRHEATDVVSNGRALGAQPPRLITAQPFGTTPVDEPSPINGIDLATYARVSKAIASSGVGPDGVSAVVRLQGIAPDDWSAAVEGWNGRFRGNMGLATRYGNLYTQA